MATTKQQWLVYYKQRRTGQAYWIEANGVTNKSPGEFLLGLLTRDVDHESMLMWATELDSKTAAALREHI